VHRWTSYVFELSEALIGNGVELLYPLQSPIIPLRPRRGVVIGLDELELLLRQRISVYWA
jgi:hypothetical protein